MLSLRAARVQRQGLWYQGHNGLGDFPCLRRRRRALHNLAPVLGFLAAHPSSRAEANMRATSFAAIFATAAALGFTGAPAIAEESADQQLGTVHFPTSC